MTNSNDEPIMMGRICMIRPCRSIDQSFICIDGIAKKNYTPIPFHQLKKETP